MLQDEIALIRSRNARTLRIGVRIFTYSTNYITLSMRTASQRYIARLGIESTGRLFYFDSTTSVVTTLVLLSSRTRNLSSIFARKFDAAIVQSDLPTRMITDYLGFLPTEVWREILLELPIYRIIGSAHSSDVLMFMRSDGFSYFEASQMQEERVKLLTICKSIYPLVLDLLYTEVVLSNQKKARCFADAATLLHPDGRRLGQRTRQIRLHVTMGVPSPIVTTLRDLNIFCPNVTSVQIFSTNDSMSLEVWKNWLWHWKESLMALAWEDWSYPEQDMLGICKDLGQLGTLYLQTEEDYGVQAGSKTASDLPNIKRLLISDGPLSKVLSFSSSPSVEWLQVGIENSHDFRFMNSLLENYKGSLQGLEITGRWWNYQHLMDASCLGAAEMGTLIISSSILRSRGPLELDPTPIASLWEIYLRLTRSEEGAELEESIKELKRVRFPQLQRIVLVLKEATGEDTREWVRTLPSRLPNIIWETRIDPFP